MLNPLQIILQICRIIFIFDTVFLAIKGEEIAVQDDADAFQQACVDALTLEYVIHICAVAVQLLCEPSDTAFLTMQFLLYFFSDVYWHFPVAPHGDVSSIIAPLLGRLDKRGALALPERRCVESLF